MSTVTVALSLLLLWVATASGARVLLIPFLNASHSLEFDGLGKPLLARGHQVFMLMDESMTVKFTRYTMVTYKTSGFFNDWSPEFQVKFIESSQNSENLQVFYDFIKGACVNMINDPELFPKLAALKLDLVVVDNFFLPCYFLVPYKLGIPWIAMGAFPSAWYLRLPVLPSVIEPAINLDFFGLYFCEETDQQSRLLRRFCRLLAHVGTEFFLRSFEDEYLREYIDYPSIAQVRENASLTLVTQSYLLSSAMPKLPHVEYVGGLTTSPAKPLPDDLEQWMSLADNVVVVSFGSRFGSLPLPMAQKLFSAFGQLPQLRFLLRFSKAQVHSDLSIPDNVKTMSWLPQNDALGHNSTRLFVTHSGNNGQLEALYHGVPMLCFYIDGDQKANAERAVRRGYGKMLYLHDFTSDQLVTYLHELTSNSTYRNKIKKASAIFHSEKHPSERAADAVEHVLKYGGDHLRPKEAYKLKWWQFYMLDVLAVVYVVLLVAAALAAVVLKCVVRGVLRKIGVFGSTKTKTE